MAENFLANLVANGAPPQQFTPPQTFPVAQPDPPTVGLHNLANIPHSDYIARLAGLVTSAPPAAAPAAPSPLAQQFPVQANYLANGAPPQQFTPPRMFPVAQPTNAQVLGAAAQAAPQPVPQAAPQVAPQAPQHQQPQLLTEDVLRRGGYVHDPQTNGWAIPPEVLRHQELSARLQAMPRWQLDRIVASQAPPVAPEQVATSNALSMLMQHINEITRGQEPQGLRTAYNYLMGLKTFNPLGQVQSGLYSNMAQPAGGMSAPAAQAAPAAPPY